MDRRLKRARIKEDHHHTGDVLMNYVAGWARVFSPRLLVVRACLTVAPFTCFAGSSTDDLRGLPPQATASTTLSVQLALPATAARGTYALELSAPDIWPATATVPAFSLRFANANTAGQAWNAAGFITTGSVVTVN